MPTILRTCVSCVEMLLIKTSIITLRFLREEEKIVEKVVARKIDNTNEFMKSKMINMEDLI